MAADFNTAMDLENELWHFALEFYQQQGIEKACLELQSTYGLSINRLIFASWCGINGITLGPSDFSGPGEEWQTTVTHPLRKLRYSVRKQKQDFPECYQKLRQAELACEQVELALLYQQVSHYGKKVAVNSAEVEKNLQTYLKSLNLPIDKQLTTHLAPLVNLIKQQYLADQ